MTTTPQPEYGAEPGLRFACILDRSGPACDQDWGGVHRWHAGDGVLWIHLERDDPTAQDWIRSASGLDPVVCDALLAEESRPRVEAIGDGLLIVLRGISRIAAGGDSDLGGDTDLVPVHIWIDAKRVISLRDKDHMLFALRDIRAAVVRGSGPARPGELLAQIAYNIVRDIEPVLDAMDDEMDALEDHVLDDDDCPAEGAAEQAVRHKLSRLRRRAIHLRRYLAPQRDALNRLQREECTWITPRDRILLREDSDRLLRFIEYLDAIRDRATILHEDLSALVGERIARSSNEISRTSNRLTAIAALLLPPSLVAGLLGMNVGGIPWSQDPLGFLYIGLIALGFSALVLLAMRSLRWL